MASKSLAYARGIAPHVERIRRDTRPRTFCSRAVKDGKGPHSLARAIRLYYSGAGPAEAGVFRARGFRHVLCFEDRNLAVYKLRTVVGDPRARPNPIKTSRVCFIHAATGR
jgi:hypothetical protein